MSKLQETIQILKDEETQISVYKPSKGYMPSKVIAIKDDAITVEPADATEDKFVVHYTAFSFERD